MMEISSASQNFLKTHKNTQLPRALVDVLPSETISKARAAK